jgi:hypothetical protein
VEVILNFADLLTDEENQLLASIFGCTDDDQLRQTLKGISKAAVSEYLEMILGKQIPTRANEMQERRLYHLMKNYFVGKIPSEAEVSAFFQLTESSSRALIRNVKTKYKFNLEQELYLVQELSRETIGL